MRIDEPGVGSVEADFPNRRIVEERLEGGGTEEAVEGVAEQGLLGVGVERRETILADRSAPMSASHRWVMLAAMTR